MPSVPSSEPPKSWQSDSQTYVLHSIQMPAQSPTSPSTTIAFLLCSSMIPLLPQVLPPAIPPPAIPPPANPCFEIKQTPNKGPGMFAARDIALGEVIITEYPAVILPYTPLPRDSTAYDELGLQLPPEQRDALLRLANCHEEDCPSPVEGIARTNAIKVELEFPEEMMEMDEMARQFGGIYLWISRANHSCGPNTVHRWNRSTFSSALTALRPIRAGEEITNTYADPTHPRIARVAHLQTNYHFLCDCPWCTLPEDEVPTSDAAREQLGNWFHLRPSFPKWSRDLCRADDAVISSHLSALELIEQEGLQAMHLLFFDELSMCYAVLGDEEGFEKWARRLVQVCRALYPELAKEMDHWLSVGEAERKQTWKMWGSRKRRQEQLYGKKRNGRRRSPSPEIDLSLMPRADSDSDD